MRFTHVDGKQVILQLVRHRFEGVGTLHELQEFSDEAGKFYGIATDPRDGREIVEYLAKYFPGVTVDQIPSWDCPHPAK